MHETGKHYQCTCAIPGIEVDRRMELEAKLRDTIGAHSVVRDGDTDFDDWKRLFIFTDSPPQAFNALGKVLAAAGIDIEACRCHVRNLTAVQVPVPHFGTMDTEEVHSIVTVLDRVGDIFGEVVRQFPDDPPKWRVKIKERISLLALSRRQLQPAVHAGFNIPPADVLGLVNMWEFVKANRQMFPHLFDPIYAQPEWQKTSARPR